MVAAKTVALVAAHGAYFATPANVGVVFEAEGVEGCGRLLPHAPVR